jgi:hypothetical protein
MSDTAITDQLVALLTQANAHATFDQSVKNIPFKKLGTTPENLPYSIWMLVEHIRIAQADILDFSINAYYKGLKWPEEYWPAEQAPKDEQSWQKSVEQIRQDRQTFIDLLNNPGADLFTPFPHGEGQNLFREALLIADHNSYHTGQIILIRRSLNDWD